MAKNVIPTDDGVAARVAAQTLAKRGSDYATEVRRLLDAAVTVIGQQGTTSRARVADIVAEAGLSNDAFYRHFASKEALVSALLEDGTERLARYLDHQMGKEASPQGKVRRWVDGVFAQTNERVAATTLAVLWNGSGIGTGMTAGRHDPSAQLAPLLHEPFTELGCSSPEIVATLVAHATLGRMADYLWSGRRPAPAEIERVTKFCIDAATSG
jgi:AcrR family transcriptional regulator